LGRRIFLRYNSSGFYEENLSLLGLCSESPVENGGPDPEKYSDIFSAAFENGITFFFVDPKSGETVEKVFGENLNKKPRGEYLLSGGISLSSLSEDSDIEKIFSDQLLHLKNGYFDYYEISGIGNENFSFFVKNNVHEIFSSLKNRGKIRHLGFSFSGTEEEWNAVINNYSWDYARLDFNFYNWDHLGADTIYHDLRKKNIPFIASDPFMGGVILDPPEEIADILKKGDPSLSMKEWALRWFFDKKGLLSVLVSPSEAKEIIEASDIISSTKTLNSSKRHYIKIASQTMFKKNCGGET